MTTDVKADFPTKLECLFEPKRYKVLYGGRGAGRSWGCARALLLKGTERPIRVLCARELQNSISDSVHRLLADQIVGLGLSNFYDVQQSRILGKNGTSFAFEGIKNNVTKIKSYEGVDYCWVEEAVKVSRSSWGILIPTIRKEQSEIWLTFNPELETDYTYRRFVRESDDSMVVVYMTHDDNPWFPDVLKIEMEADKIRDPDYYQNVWLGYCLQVLEGAVYSKELRNAQADGRICTVPYDRSFPVDCFFDLGRADQTAIWFGQKVAMQYRVLDFYQNSMEDIAHYLKELQRKEYVYGTIWLPHDARAKRLGTKMTIEEQVRQSGFRTMIVPRMSLVDGINATRSIFGNCWFDEEKCEEGLNALRHYRYRVWDGQLSKEPLHDSASDAADAFRYLAVTLREAKTKSESIWDRFRRDKEAKAAQAQEWRYRPSVGLGWMR